MSEAPSILTFVHQDVTFDQINGLGSVPNLAETGYLGFVSFIRPSVFLRLCPPLEDEDHTFDDVLAAGQPIATGFLNVDLEDPAGEVRGHEGRHRMRAVLRRCGDEPVPVVIFPLGGDRARHVEHGHLCRLAAGMLQERWAGGHPRFVEGPIFDRVILGGQDLQISNLDPAPSSGMAA